LPPIFSQHATFALGKRRPFSSEELTLLIQAAERGPVFQCIPGPDRAVLYIVGAYTGYRRGEIGSVTIRSFDFDSDPLTLSVEAGHSNNPRGGGSGAAEQRYFEVP
jgi:hypothetical protein